MGVDFIPERDADAVGWMSTFAACAGANAGAYMLSQSDVETIREAVEAFKACQARAVAPDTRTKLTVRRKNETRLAAEQLIRQYARILKPNAGISDRAKLALGIPLENRARVRRPGPSTSPAVAPIAATPGRQVLVFKDSITPTRRAMPFGATSLQLSLAVGDTCAEDPATARFLGCFTRSPVTIPFTSPDGGKWATYFGRWMSRRGEFGPWSAPASMRIVA
jgi:hypothetical protein